MPWIRDSGAPEEILTQLKFRLKNRRNDGSRKDAKHAKYK